MNRAWLLPRRLFSASDIVVGGIWLGPGSGVHGNGHHADFGQANANAVVQAALQAGIVEFDTAPWYGGGAAEERLGRALASVSNTQQVKVGTKVGRLLWEHDGAPALAGFDQEGRPPLQSRICRNDYSAHGARLSLQHSLDRLGLDAVHTLRIHDPNDNSNNRAGNTTHDEVAQALSPNGMLHELRFMRDQQHLIHHVGLGMNINVEGHMGAPDQVLRLLHGAPRGTFDSALLAGGWNLLSQSGWHCLEACHQLRIPVYLAGIFASGYLADDNKPYAYQDAVPSRLQTKKRAWKHLAHSYGCSLPAVALAFAGLPPAVSRLVLGVATPMELQQSLEWVADSNHVPESLWQDAVDLGLLQD
jgi:D-threo-aldose 1-dehydrogenase